MNIIIRSEQTKDYKEITLLNDLAFNQPNEGKLVEKLREDKNFITELSIVAVYYNKVVGHILFFPIQINSGFQKHTTLALAPMSVLPEFQKKGIGKKLVRAGLIKSKELAFDSVIVLGHSGYYPKFGFFPASKFGIKAPFEVPDNVFFAIELKENSLAGKSGIVDYPKVYMEV
jgi:predicted N-acetyltransferase YhbS